MVKKIINLTVTVLIAFFAVSCNKVDSTDLIENTPVFQRYKVEYHTYDNQSIATANFWVRNTGGSRIKLTGDSYIKFNNEKPNEYSSLFHDYIWKSNKRTDIKFTYQKDKDKSFNNDIYIDDMVPISIPTNLDSFKLNGETKIIWEGSPLGKNETITVTINQANKSTVISRIYEEGINEIKIDALFLKELNSGEATLYLEREKFHQLDTEDQNTGGEKIVSIKDKKTIILI